MKEAFVGFDSAWAGNVSGAICYAVFEGDTPIEVNIPQLSDFADSARIINMLEQECDDVLVAIDQPIIVPKFDKGRPVDSVVKSFMVRLAAPRRLRCDVGGVTKKQCSGIAPLFGNSSKESGLLGFAVGRLIRTTTVPL